MQTAYPLYGAIVGATVTVLVFVAAGHREQTRWLRDQRLTVCGEVVAVCAAETFPDDASLKSLGALVTRLRVLGPHPVVKKAALIELAVSTLLTMPPPVPHVTDAHLAERAKWSNELAAHREQFVHVCSDHLQYGIVVRTARRTLRQRVRRF